MCLPWLRICEFLNLCTLIVAAVVVEGACARTGALMCVSEQTLREAGSLMKMVAFDVASASDSTEQIIIKHTHVHTHTRSLSLPHPPFIYSTMLQSSNRLKPEEERQFSWRTVGVNIRNLLHVTSHPFGNVAPPLLSHADKCTPLFTVRCFH